MTQPGYGPFDPYGRRLPAPSPQPPPSRRLLPWVIVGGAVVISGLGVLLVMLLRPQDMTGAATAAPSPTASSAPAGTSASASGRLPGGAQVADRNSGGRARFAGSDRVALSWVQAMADGEFQAAYDLSCTEVRKSAADAATLGNSFVHKTLGGRRISTGTLDSIIYNQDADSDIASFTLQLDDGEEFLLLVYVQSDGTVCDFI
jgi:hypothetical protein